MDAKKIEKANHKIAIKERISTQLVNLLSTSKGEEITRNIGFMTLPELIHKYGMHCLKRAGNPKRQMNMLMHAVAKAGQGLNIRHTKVNIVDYTKLAEKEAEYDKQRARFVANYQKNKPAVRLTKYEQKLLNKRDQWKIKLNGMGKPITKTEKFIREGELAPRMLYDKETGIPIYQYTPKNNKLGLAMKLHLYELHKMAKWDKKNPYPSKLQLKQDLFPTTLVSAYRTRRNLYNEHVREILSACYCGTSNDPRYKYKLFEVGSHNNVTWENEADPYIYGYPFIGLKANAPRDILEEKLKIAKRHIASKNIIALKAYDLFGNEVMQVAA